MLKIDSTFGFTVGLGGDFGGSVILTVGFKILGNLFSLTEFNGTCCSLSKILSRI